MGEATSNMTERFVGDNDPIKFGLSDDGVLRTDLDSASSIEARFMVNGSTLFYGPVDPIDGDDTWNCQYDFAIGDTDAPADPNVYVTVVNSGTTATYGLITLEIKNLT